MCSILNQPARGARPMAKCASVLHKLFMFTIPTTIERSST
jgi:hypothetical protein